MNSLEQLKADNDRAAARELAELRADTVKGLRFAFQISGVQGVVSLLEAAEALTPLFDAFTDWGRSNEG